MLKVKHKVKRSSCVARDSRLISAALAAAAAGDSMQSGEAPPGEDKSWSKQQRYLEHMWGGPPSSESTPTTPSDWKADCAADSQALSQAGDEDEDEDEDEDPHKGSKACSKAKASVKGKPAANAKDSSKGKAMKAMKTKEPKDKGSGMKAMKAKK